MSSKRPFGAQLEYELRSRRERESRRKLTHVIGTVFVASLLLSLILLASA